MSSQPAQPSQRRTYTPSAPEVPAALSLLNRSGGYGTSFPVSDTKDFTEGTSWRNFGVDLLAVVRPNTSVGLSVGWNVFDDITTEVSSLEDVDVQGTQYRYVNSVPVLANIRQYVGTRGGPRPFFGLGVGAQYVELAVDVGQWRISDSTWHFDKKKH